MKCFYEGGVTDSKRLTIFFVCVRKNPSGEREKIQRETTLNKINDLPGKLMQM